MSVLCLTLPAGILEWVAMPCSRGLPHPGVKPRSLAWQADSLPAEPSVPYTTCMQGTDGITNDG